MNNISLESVGFINLGIRKLR